MMKWMKKAVLTLPLRGPLHGLRSILHASGLMHPRVYQYLRFRGDFVVPVNDGQTFRLLNTGAGIENTIFWTGLYGDWEPISMELWACAASSSQVILDVGANTGVYSLVAKAVNPGASVFAFEPSPMVHSTLAYNAKLNNVDIQCLQTAVSNEDSRTAFYEVDDESGYSSSLNSEFLRDTAAHSIEVDTVRLDTFMKRSAIEGLDLIKVDVETHEAEVFEGAGESLAAYKPVIFVEILNDVVGAAVESYVKDLGYRYFAIDDHKRTIRQMPSITRHGSLNYILCTESAQKTLNLPGVAK